MNKLIIIGNLTNDPKLRTTQAGDAVCSFTVAVNRRHSAQAKQPEADFFHVSAWRQLGENCARYLAKGRKVYVSGPVSCRIYQGNDGKMYANMELTANEVEFLSAKGEDQQPAQPAPQPAPAPQYNLRQPPGGGFTQVDESELPF